MGTACSADASTGTKDAEVVTKEPTQEQETAAQAEATATPVPAEGEAAAEDPAPPPPAQPKLFVTFIGARCLRNADRITGESDCYCTLQVGDRKEVFKTNTQNNTLNPCWMQEAGVVEYNEGESLVFTVYDADSMKKPDLLGTAKLDCNMLDQGFHGELELDKAGKDKAYLMIKVRKADKEEYPPPPDQEITIELEKTAKKPHGVELDLSDGKTAYVLGVKVGPFKSYNDEKKPAEQLKAGDSIIKVNEEEGSAVKLDALMKSQANLVLKVRRSFKASIILDRQGKGKLGFEPKAVGNTLRITNVSADDGAMKQWNSDHPDQKVQEGDRIIAVGGQRGKGAQLAKKLNGIGPIQLTLECPAREKKSGWFSML